MKQQTLFRVRSFFLLCFLSLFSFAVWAQENTEGSGGSDSKTTTSSTKTTDVNISTDGSHGWYTQPWVWIVGAAVFILLLVALLSGNRGRDTVTTSDRVTVKKTVERDGDTI